MSFRIACLTYGAAIFIVALDAALGVRIANLAVQQRAVAVVVTGDAEERWFRTGGRFVRAATFTEARISASAASGRYAEATCVATPAGLAAVASVASVATVATQASAAGSARVGPKLSAACVGGPRAGACRGAIGQEIEALLPAPAGYAKRTKGRHERNGAGQIGRLASHQA
jgi:hypothetical protein